MHQQIVQPAGNRGRHHRYRYSIFKTRLRAAFSSTHPTQALAHRVGVCTHIMIVDVFGDIREQFTADLIGFPVKNDDIYRHIVLQQKFPDGVHRHAKRLIFWITVNAGGEQRERRRLAMVFLCQRKACPVAGNELFPFSIAAAAPHRTDGMNHILAGQAVRLCNLSSAQRLASKHGSKKLKLLRIMRLLHLVKNYNCYQLYSTLTDWVVVIICKEI